MLMLVGSLLCSLAIQRTIPHGYIVLLLLATAGSGWFGRRAVGLLAGALSAIATEYYFLSPTHSFLLEKSEVGQLALYGIAALAVGWYSGV